MKRGTKKNWKKQSRARLHSLIEYFVKTHEPLCQFCKEHVTLEDVRNNKWTIHHIDLNENNEDIHNKTLVHRGCHRSYHMKLK